MAFSYHWVNMQPRFVVRLCAPLIWMYVILCVKLWFWFIDSYESDMDLSNQLCSSVRLARQLSIANGKNLNVQNYSQTFQLNFIMPCTLIDIIDFYHFVLFQWPWLWLGLTRSCKAKTVGLIFSHTFNPLEWNLMCVQGVQVEHSDTVFEWELLNQEK